MKLAAICFFVAGLLTMACAQPVVISGNAGYNADSPYNRLYNIKTVITFKGKVTGVQLAPPMKGMLNAVTLMVKSTTGKTWQVDVGPEWYINNQKTQIKIHDNVQVTGSRVTIDRHEVILAEQIVNLKTKSVLALRRPYGRPYWDAVTTVEGVPDPKGTRQISGQIIAMDTFVDGTNGVTQRLRIQTDDGEVLVALAPQWFMERQAVQLSLGQMINVDAFAPIGTPTAPVGTGLAAPPIVFATRVGFGSQWMVLRSVNGRPVWFAVDGG
jgi:hypothetical protein